MSVSAKTGAHLVLMVNQIAANLAAQGEAEAIAQTAQHIRLYWDPRMKAGILAGPQDALSPIARAAIADLRDQSGTATT